MLLVARPLLKIAFLVLVSRSLLRPSLPFSEAFRLQRQSKQSTQTHQRQLFARSSLKTLLFATTTTMPVTHAPDSLIPEWLHADRTRVLTDPAIQPPPLDPSSSSSSHSSVVYWMQRDVRTVDNWALLWADYLANKLQLPLRVVYALPPPPASSGNSGDDSTTVPPVLKDMKLTARHGQFLLGGLECVRAELAEKNVPLHVVQPESHDAVGEAVCREAVIGGAAVVVGDFSPLREPARWMSDAAAALGARRVPLYQVDAHNVVPVWVASDKREVGARTLRPKIHKHVNRYLQKKFPKLRGNSRKQDLPAFDREQYEAFLQMDESVPAVEWATPGTEAGLKQFELFLAKGLKQFDSLRNDPTLPDICSNMSPWINHGHVSFQRLTKAITKFNKYATGTAAYIEEGVVRRELSDNFVFYTSADYDSLTAAAGWAQETLETHSTDRREHVYSLEEFETAQTHDDLWNAAQLQVVREGQMHGFLRMYWAKKILEWSESPALALRIAQYLNDKYALDGRDPNGFTGVGWSIMGIHDMGWKERPIFGKIRYMNYAGCKRKFKVATFVNKYKGAAANAAKAASKRKGQGTLDHKTKKRKK